jgi:signal-transduction protein with cAMP-binding, CBS, and nucleotidyltransferase domain
MPTVTTAKSDITTDDAVSALQAQLGSKYTVSAKDSGTRQVLSVKQSALAFASVHMVQEDGVTKFHVHGGGLIIGRIVNELSIARKVAAAIKAAPELGAAG